MAREKNTRRVETPEVGYAEAVQRIKKARNGKETLLDLSSLQLTSAPKELGELQALTILDLSYNQLTSLPTELMELQALKQLDLHSNQLTSIPKELGKLQSLTILRLDNNQMTSAPNELGELQSLTILRLDNNKLTSAPKELGELQALTRLDLDNNQLTLVPKELGKLQALTELHLDHNQLTSVPKELGALQALTGLFLSSNQLTSVPKELGKLLALTELHLDYNQLASVPGELAELQALRKLYLDHNQLISLPKELGNLWALTELHLDHNQLTSVPGELGNLRALKRLELDHNQLNSLPNELGKLKSLKYFFLHGNPQLELPPEVLGPLRAKDAAKPAEILAYYFGLRTATTTTKLSNRPRPLNEAKILVVGEPGVGKTMLVEWLTKEKAKKNPEWTKGIKILPWKVRCADGEGDDIKINIWDFGGQEIMQATHQFFLTERSLYLLVLDSRENEEQSKIRYWLDKIRAFGGDSPVIVALNKRDEGQHDPDESRLRQDYPANLREKGFFRTACKAAKGVNAGTGIDELREAIACRVRQLDNVTQTVPGNYLKAKEAFEKESKSKKRMDRRSFDKICARNGVKDELDRDTLLSYLKSLGSLFHYNRGNQAHKILVLNPEWLTGGVYKILTDHEVRNCGGVLTPKDVSRIFALSRVYDVAAREFILEMMEGDPFELSFKVPFGEENRLIPELLPPNEPDHGINPVDSLNMEYHYKFLPGGLIPRFIVRMHNAVMTDTGSYAAAAWKNGVVVTVDQRRVLVRGVRESKRVYVSAQGREPAARRALAIVRQNLSMVHADMKHLDVTEHVAFPDDPGKTIAYSELLQYEVDEGSAYLFRPPGATRKYSIRELLEGFEEPDWRGRVYEHDDGANKIRIRMEKVTIEDEEMLIGNGRVFISYANEPDPSHAKLVHELADRLREQGVDAFIDQYVDEMGPKVDWPLWMNRQIQESRIVLMVCSPAYLRRVEGKEAPGKGLGATYEGKLVRQEMYNNGVINIKYRPVLLSKDHQDCIPLDIQGATHFRLYEPDGYNNLYRALTGQPSIVAPPLGKPVIMPPK